MKEVWNELKELRTQQKSIKDMVQLVLEHVLKIEKSVSQHMLPLPPSIHNDPSNWEYPFIPPITPVASQHMPTQVLQQELLPTTPFSQSELSPTTPVASQHIMTPLSQQQLSPPVPTTPVAPQHVLSPSTLIAQHPQSHQFMHPLQPEVPAPEWVISISTLTWPALYPKLPSQH